MTKLNLKELKAAVFDWDNTLAESRTALVYCVNQVLQEYSMPEWNIVKAKRDNTLSFRDNFPRIFGDKASEAYEKYTKIYLQNVRKMITTFPKTLEVLQFLKSRGVKIMVMSNKDRKLLDYELPLLFNPALFDNVVCGHEAIKDKPYSEHLFWTLKDMFKPQQINRQNVWVIGDSPQDSACAKNAGALPIRIGKSIWEDETNDTSGIIFFDSFVDFYKTLLLS